MANPMANPQQQYLKTQIETASQPQLLLMLFDAAVKKLNIAKRAIQAKSIEKAHIELTKVQSIFTELMVALDFDIGGELAEQLMRIYDFIYHRLVQANIKQDISIIDEVLPIIDTLRQSWMQAVDIYEKEGGTAPAKVNSIDKISTSAVQSKPLSDQAVQQTAKKTGTYATAKIPPASQAGNDQQRPRLNLRG